MQIRIDSDPPAADRHTHGRQGLERSGGRGRRSRLNGARRRLLRRALRRLDLREAGRRAARAGLGVGARSAAKAVTGEAVRLGAARIGGTLAQSLSRGAGPAAVAAAIVQLAVQAWRRELTVRSAVTTVAQAGASFGATHLGVEAGSALSPLAGTVLGLALGFGAWAAVGRLGNWGRTKAQPRSRSPERGRRHARATDGAADRS